MNRVRLAAALVFALSVVRPVYAQPKPDTMHLDLTGTKKGCDHGRRPPVKSTSKSSLRWAMRGRCTAWYRTRYSGGQAGSWRRGNSQAYAAFHDPEVAFVDLLPHLPHRHVGRAPRTSAC